MDYSQRAERYAEAVLSGEILACKWVKLACKRFLNDLKRQGKKDFPYIYDRKKANRICAFMENLPHVKGSEWAGKPFILQDWQCFIECNIFGWVHKDNGFRRFSVVIEIIPRKNGKSMRVGARGIYLAFADSEKGAEVYCGATSEKQAYEVYRPAWMMVKETTDLREHYTIDLAGNAKNPGAMYCAKDMSKFEVLIGNPGDGASPHGAIVDEYHEHETDNMVETMQTGMGARRQPLLSIISTAGTILNGPCHEMQKDLQKILEGTVTDERIFGVIYGIDKEDAWDSKEALIKANPNYGVSVYPEFLQTQLDQAKRSARKQNTYKTKHLNEWVGAKTAWMNMLFWNRQRMAGKPKMEDFKGCPARLAADLSSKIDVAAIDITFEKDEKYYSFKKFFVPEDATKENDKYEEFVTSGHLETTEGSMIDQEVIEEYIEEICKEYGINDCTFDEWNAAYMMTRLQKSIRSAEITSFPFRTQFVSEPMKQIEALVLAGKYFHDGNPVMDWMIGNVASYEDRRGNVFPNKDRPHDKRCKIDGVAAAIMSMARWMVEPPEKKQYKIIHV